MWWATTNPWTISDPLLCRAEGAEGGDAGGGGASPPPPPPPPPADAGGGEKAFYESFANNDLKVSAAGWGFKSAEDMARAYGSMEKRLGVPIDRHLVIPADPADKDGMRAVWSKLGLPEKADGYGFKLADTATDADKAFLERAVTTMHEAGVPKAHAEAMFALWNAEGQRAQEAQAAAFKAAAEAGQAQLKQTWGQAYDRYGKEIGAMLVKNGAPELAKELDSPEKLGNHPQLSLFLAKVLDRMAEPGGAGGESGDGAAGERAMTPAQAKAEANKLEAHPAFRDKRHAQHKAIVDERNRFLAMTT